MSFGLVLDEPEENDLVEEHHGINFIVNDSLYETYRGFSINSEDRNGLTYYRIKPENAILDGGGCSSCSSCD